MTDATTPEVYTYEWTGDWEVIMADHVSPQGAAVSAVPGEQFETMEPVSTFYIPAAEPISPNAIAAALAEEQAINDLATEVEETAEDSTEKAPAPAAPASAAASPATSSKVDDEDPDETE